MDLLTVALLLFRFVSAVFSFEPLDITQDRTNKSAVWAVLVAGSCGFENYRHQADVLHAYHILRERGVPSQNIITMVCNDIANDTNNPYEGMVFNEPNGPNLLEDAKMDYQGKDVSPQTFMEIIWGNATGPVLNSTENDRVFIYYAGHGENQTLSFQVDNPLDQLNANHIKALFEFMYQKKMYKRLVFYVEACHSGSLFSEDYAKDKNIYAVTAASAETTSFSANCIKLPDRGISSEYSELCLGDEFSSNWMAFAEEAEPTVNTLLDQYQFSRKNTLRSQVQQFGDTSFVQEPIGYYQGNIMAKEAEGFKDDKVKTFLEVGERETEVIPVRKSSKKMRPTLGRKGAVKKIKGFIYSDEKPITRKPAKFVPKKLLNKKFGSYPVRDMAIMQLKNKVDNTKNATVKAMLQYKLDTMKRNRELADAHMKDIFEKLDNLQNDKTKEVKAEWPCRTKVIQQFTRHCYKLSRDRYVAKYTGKLYSYCDRHYKQEEIEKVLEGNCQKRFAKQVV
ncbi:unnamed protein product [Bursaphelenchus xylophilus]|uniref:(pine wood nematode) hypothetical protein n=1 Tax=Bursaphelenchus xylophilus TaxID=6326 RepID=A0A7I8WZV3_BURXY|nr:unnamed protein product [Bursaphelenchus xylophilus]CAG9129557.1 unnamed protein product [Bursaphelenchus xylophilus]